MGHSHGGMSKQTFETLANWMQGCWYGRLVLVGWSVLDQTCPQNWGFVLRLRAVKSTLWHDMSCCRVATPPSPIWDKVRSADSGYRVSFFGIFNYKPGLVYWHAISMSSWDFLKNLLLTW